MIRFLSCILVFLVSGCAPSHFIRTDARGVSLFLNIPEAREVLFAASIESFQVHQVEKNSKGLWVINDIANQEFKYFYIVDGKPYVPECRYSEKDDFGAKNCIYQP